MSQFTFLRKIVCGVCLVLLTTCGTELRAADTPIARDFGSRLRLADSSADGELFASANEQGRILCRQTGGSVVHTFYICEPRVIALSADGRLLAAAGRGAGSPPAIKVWDIQNGKLLYTLATEVADDTLLKFSPDGKRLVSSRPGLLEVWDLLTGSRVDTHASHEPISHIYFRSLETKSFITVSSGGKSRSFPMR